MTRHPNPACRTASLAVLLLLAASQLPAQTAVWQDSKADIEARVSDLVSQLTLDEKLNALSTIPDVPRLGIKGSDHVEGLHGLALGGPAQWGGWGKEQIPTTQFPQVSGLGATWDANLIRQVAAVEGYEARYIFNSTGRGGIVMRAPNADIVRDIRWGRSEESYGEDPFLVSTLSDSFIRGLQGDDPKYLLTASLMKHFLANSNEENRGGSSSDFDQALFWEYYGRSFRTGITRAKAQAYMTAYNAWNGIPMTAHPVIREVTMQDWGLDGIVCTDAGAMSNMVKDHHYSRDLPEAAAQSIKAGINQFLEERQVYRPAVKKALERGLITEADIDRNLKGVFRVMIRLGLLDPPEQVPYSAIRGKTPVWQKPEHQALALQATLESIVLLKNQDQVLPLDRKKIRKVALIGPWADQVLLDWYSGTPGYAVSILEGLQRALPEAEISWVAGVPGGEDQAAELARTADVAIVVEGNHPTAEAGWAQAAKDSYGKEAVDRLGIELEDEYLVKAVLEANPRTILVLQTSFPYAINWSQEHVPAIVHLTHNSQESGTALARVLLGDYNPAGRLVHTWPASLDQLPEMMDYDIRQGRTYMYSGTKPLYPFGFGLGYSSFAWSDFSADRPTIDARSAVKLSLQVRNTGRRDGDEVVQIYVARPDRRPEEPLRMLRAFKRVPVPAGRTVKVELVLKGEDLLMWDQAAKAPAVRPGKLLVQAGASSSDIRQTLELTVR